MTPHLLIATALMLGVYVMLAGSWGLLYSLAIVLGRPALRPAAWLCYALHLGLMLAIVIATPLGPWWKLLIAASSAAYLAIPPIVWRYLNRIHRSEEKTHDSRPARRPGRTLAGLGRGA